ncbi:MAG: hypothetical protein PUE47_04975 [Lachnospiraceae bacterium]|nr:hypothetical protein [Lachnospiraceae bacterium]
MRRRESFLFLIELVMAVLIFFIAAAICVSVFTRAHVLNRSSRELTAAVSAEKNIAELLSASESPEDAKKLITDAYPNAEIAGEEEAAGGDSEIKEEKKDTGPETEVTQEKKDTGSETEVTKEKKAAGSDIENAEKEQETGSDGKQMDGISVRIGFDSNLQPTGGEMAYLLTADLSVSGKILSADMHFYPTERDGTKTGDSVYNLYVEHAVPHFSGREGHS